MCRTPWLQLFNTHVQGWLWCQICKEMFVATTSYYVCRILLVVYSWLAIIDDSTIASIDHNNDLITAAFAADRTLDHVLHTPCRTNRVYWSIAQYQQWSCWWSQLHALILQLILDLTLHHVLHTPCKSEDKYGMVYNTISTMIWWWSLLHLQLNWHHMLYTTFASFFSHSAMQR